MLNKKVVAGIVLSSWFCLMLIPLCHADPLDGFGQVIHIRTNFRRLMGSARLSIIIRDLDHNQNIPYLFEIKKPNNSWLLYTHSRNYLILSSNLQINRYSACCNQYKNYRLSNFCQLESCGHIMRNRAMSVTITGDLTPHPYTFRCQTTPHPTSGFTIVTLPDCPCPVVKPATVTPIVPAPTPVVAAAPPVPNAAPVEVTSTDALPPGASAEVVSAPIATTTAVQPVIPTVATPEGVAPPLVVTPPGTVVSVPQPIVSANAQPQPIVSAPDRAVPLVVTPPQPTLPSPVIPRVPGGPP